MAGALGRICGVAILCTIAGVLLRQIKGELSGLLRLGGGVLIFSLFLPLLGDALEQTGLLVENREAYLYAEVMLRALGLAFLCRICADICRECGEGMIATGVEMAGKLAILLLCFPLLQEIIGYAREMLALVE